MSDKTYKNSGGMWLKKAVGGRADIDGREYYTTLVATGVDAHKAPSHTLYIKPAWDYNLPVVDGAMFKPKSKEGFTTDDGTKLPPAVAEGSIVIDGQKWWVNVYLVTERSSDRSPVANVRFKKAEEKQAKASPPPAPPGPPIDDDDIPF